MKTLIYILSTLFIAACNTAPMILPDPTIGHNIIAKKLDYDILNSELVCSWGWIFWYVPILVLVLGWAWKEWISPSLKSKSNKPV